MNGRSSYGRISFLAGFVLFAGLHCQSTYGQTNCGYTLIYCPKTKSCHSLSDSSCSSPVCSGSRFPCDDGATCYSVRDRCDRVRDCDDNTDELYCGSYREPSTYKCLLSNKCDHVTTTRSYKPRPINCLFYACDNGHACYSSSERCDGIMKCTDGSDEDNCYNSCTYSNRCDDGGGCYSDSARCDEYNDCSDGSDEQDCPSTGLQAGPVVAAVVGVVIISLLVICCKYCLQKSGRPSSPTQGSAAYHSAANFREANPTFQSSHTYNNNNSSSQQDPTRRTPHPATGSANGYSGSSPPYPQFSATAPPAEHFQPSSLPYSLPNTSSTPHSRPAAGESPPGAPPPAYETLFPENTAK